MRKFPKVAESVGERQAFIAAAATRVIAHKGVEGLTVRAVAAEAGCSRGLVEHYFRTKEALVNAANEWANAAYLERVANAVGKRSGLEALAFRLKQLLPYSDATLDEWRVRIAFWQLGQHRPPLEASARQSFRQVFEELLQDMRDAQARDEIAPSVPVQVTAEIVLILITGLATLCLNDRQLRTCQALDRRVEMILGVLKSGNLAELQVGDPEVDY